ncbi:ABC transporter permease [Mesorhizobium sp. B2-8-5]|uniref:ABC transporter permease n=1 Tax=Mesorhizobium sp. B2-8-5 TaxID=2589903 RepID=UPI00112960C0|nr:ABC transporter permease [Mesorhizobium sp. B2-8-5]UCI28488.1 ABC transporter permease [Mesorhizobium sp. B2-8-5]
MTEPALVATGTNNAKPAPREYGARRFFRLYGEAYALVALLALIAIFFTLLPATRETFPTSANLRIVIANQAVLAIVALAAFVPLIVNEFDVSVGANLGLSSIFAAVAMSAGMPWFLALLLAVAIGTSIGVVNGVLVTRAGINSLISTLGISIIIHGSVTWKTGGVSIVSNIPPILSKFGSGTLFGIPLPFFALLIVALLLGYVIIFTPFGRYLYAIGSNISAAKLVGINTTRMVILSFVISGALSGFAGFIQIARTGGANPRVGESFTLPALAAAFLSASAILPGTYNVAGVIVAVFFLATINSGLNLAGAEVYVNDLVNGFALILGVGLSKFLGRNRA